MPQENNMAEVIRLLHTVIGKVDGLAADLNGVKTDVGVLKTDLGILKTDVGILKTDARELRSGLSRVDAKVDFLTGRFEDVARVVIKDTQRTSGIERRVDDLERKAN